MWRGSALSDRPAVTLLVDGVRLPLGAGQNEAVQRALRLAGVRPAQLLSAGLHKVSVDARHGQPKLVYSVALTVPAETASAFAGRAGVRVLQPRLLRPAHGQQPLPAPPVVCGLGPAGLFAAFLLAQEGYRPLVLERGPEVTKRVQAVQAFEAGGPLDENANIQFGEGGAGTFSDGKLTTRIHDPLCDFVTRTLCAHGAPAEIAIRQRPHIGTDLLRDIIVGIRRSILEMGGQVLFDTALTGLATASGRLQAVKTAKGTLPCAALVLAPGHSARDTFAMLAGQGIALQCKPFSVGFRIEHLQKDIDAALYHEAAGHPDLPRGEYQLSSHIGARCVYTFCMCPGGQVVAAASEPQGVVTNGMSYHARDGQNANAAVVVSVSGTDFDDDPWRAVAFQRRLERQAYRLGGGGYRAPAQDVASFLEGGVALRPGAVRPTYPLGVQAADLSTLLGVELSDALRAGLRDFERKLHGYAAPQAVLTGVETRTSSPLRLPRGEDMQSVSLAGLYPAGEGAGYAGGIMSAAVDGLRAALAVMARWAPPA